MQTVSRPLRIVTRGEVRAEGWSEATARATTNILSSRFAPHLAHRSLDRTGRLVVYGFHTNMTHGTSLNPISWLRMLWGAMKMPSFDAMMMTLDSRGVLGFNLSFFENETELIGQYFDILNGWLEQGIILPKINLFGIDEVGKAHELIQSGKSQGKIVIETSNNRK